MIRSDVARPIRQIGHCGWIRAWVVMLAAVVVCGGSGAVLTQPAAARVIAGAHNMPVAAAAGHMQSNSPGQQCFYSTPKCTSADPAVVFVMELNSDTTGCTFHQDTAWGDGSPDTVETYNGGKEFTVLATFTHTYA